MKLLRFNQPPLEIPDNKFMAAISENNLIEIHYYDENDDEQVTLGYHLMR